MLAPDKFKGSLTAPAVAAALAAGLAGHDPGVVVRSVPIADGGDGTLEAVLACGFSAVPVTVHGPTGDPVRAAFGRRGDTAVVELAEASGLRRLPGGRLEPLRSSTYGTGELIRAALDAGCHEVVLGLGGSASTDGGAGLLQALGLRLLDDRGRDLPPGGAALAGLSSVDDAGLDPRLAEARFVLATDVDNPLLGPAGAAAVYGPQKGAGPADVDLLERALGRWAGQVAALTGSDHSAQDHSGRAGAGAAGGVGFAALALLGAAVRPGIELILDLVDFEQHLLGARLVITGEGSLDEQSLHGKAPVGVATAAARHGVPTIAVAGRCELTPARLEPAGLVAAYALTDLEPDPAICIAEAARLLEHLARTVIGPAWPAPPALTQ